MHALHTYQLCRPVLTAFPGGHTAPCDRKEMQYHWHFEVTPSLTETAGFERGTGFHSNRVMPEDAAQILREGPKAEAPH